MQAQPHAPHPAGTPKRGDRWLLGTDALDFRDITGRDFHEPTTELCLVDGLQDGEFAVVLLPTDEQDRYRSGGASSRPSTGSTGTPALMAPPRPPWRPRGCRLARRPDHMSRRLRMFVALVALVSACGPAENPSSMPREPAPAVVDTATPASSARPGPRTPLVLPEVRGAADIAAHNGRFVYVFGTYEQVSVAKGPGGSPRGHVAIRLADGSPIHLHPPWHPEAIRPAEEREQYTGHEVVVMGILLDYCPPPPDERAYLMVSCMTEGFLVLDTPAYRRMRASFEQTADGAHPP